MNFNVGSFQIWNIVFLSGVLGCGPESSTQIRWSMSSGSFDFFPFSFFLLFALWQILHFQIALLTFLSGALRRALVFIARHIASTPWCPRWM